MACYLTKPFGIKFSLVEPGGISSDFAKSVMAHVGQTGGMLEDEYLPILQKYIGGAQERAAAGETGIYQTSEEVAQVVLDVAENKNPPLRIRTSKWSNKFCDLKTASDPDGTKLVNEVIERFL